ncbi:MAG: hypothetical protein K8S20_09385 [Chloroflexi bacterium]|nr:hypothetical protein [Chloroflexota bacterium]
MTRRVFLFAGALLTAIAIAFLLRDVVERMIVAPLAYIWWVLKLYYSAFPQYILWIVLILVAVFSAVSSLMPESETGGGPKPAPVVLQGRIAGLAEWLNKSRHGGIYYKWLIANRLGKTAREILAQREGHTVSKKFGRLQGQDWHPSENMDSYLESGLNGSFADYPQPRFWTTPLPTPLDLDTEQVVDYLEGEMETHHDGNHKGI